MSAFQRFGRSLSSYSPKKLLKSNVVALTAGTVLGQGILVLAAPLVTRLYSPEMMGAFGIYIAILSIFSSICCLSYERAIVLPDDETVALHVKALCFIVLLGTCSFLFLLVLIFRNQLIQKLHAPPELSNFLFLVPLSLLFGGIFQILNYSALRNKMFKDMARTGLHQNIAQVVVQLSAGYFGLGLLGLTVADVVGRASGSRFLATKEWSRNADLRHLVGWQGIKHAARRYQQFPKYSCGSTLLNTLTTSFPAFMLSSLFNTQVVGWYSLAQRVVGLPMMLIGESVSKIYLAEAAQAQRDGDGKLRILFLRTLRRLVLVGIGPILLTGILSPIVFPFLFGENWRTAGEYVRLMCPMFFLQFIAAPLGWTLDVTESQGLHLWRESIRIGLLITSFAVARSLQFDSLHTIGALSAAGTLGYAIYVLFSWYSVNRTRAAVGAA